MGARIEVIRGDITVLDVDVIVNAANSALMGGGGVDGAIHRAAGPLLHEECMKIAASRPAGQACPAGEAVITGAYALPCKKVIHTVGPVWHGGVQGEAALLASCYRKSLLLAEKSGLTSIAFPNISTGVYGYPKDRAASVAVGAVRSALEETPEITGVLFVCFDRENLELYRRLLGAR
ncbi:MAG: O-acetyl-ADP-ribose deacetylase [Spirochaetaceae bacterium]|jgi:O-acetyl-ADP-ribose deacetylase (regulator of RNase III)|nr:O-acetyl-ADP-ribose deacetylase [Spirochaetaceae bacterium]